MNRFARSMVARGKQVRRCKVHVHGKATLVHRLFSSKSQQTLSLLGRGISHAKIEVLGRVVELLQLVSAHIPAVQDDQDDNGHTNRNSTSISISSLTNSFPASSRLLLFFFFPPSSFSVHPFSSSSPPPLSVFSSSFSCNEMKRLTLYPTQWRGLSRNLQQASRRCWRLRWQHNPICAAGFQWTPSCDAD